MSDDNTERTEAELRGLAARGAAELEGASANDLLRWTRSEERRVGKECW